MNKIKIKRKKIKTHPNHRPGQDKGGLISPLARLHTFAVEKKAQRNGRRFNLK
jgi:hypothetical protein